MWSDLMDKFSRFHNLSLFPYYFSCLGRVFCETPKPNWAFENELSTLWKIIFLGFLFNSRIDV